MKIITIAGVVLAVGVMAVLATQRDVIFDNSFEVTKEVKEVIKEVSPDWAIDEDAVKAAKDVIRRKELEAELVALEASFEDTTATYEAEKEAYVEIKKQLELDLGLY